VVDGPIIGFIALTVLVAAVGLTVVALFDY